MSVETRNETTMCAPNTRMHDPLLRDAISMLRVSWMLNSQPALVCGGGPRSCSLADMNVSAAKSTCLLSVLLLCGCVTTATRNYRAAEEPRVLEAAMLEQLRWYDTNRMVFVSFSDSQRREYDPPDSYLERLNMTGIPARKASQSTRDENASIVDRITREPGAVYSAGVIRWLSNSKVEVRRGHHIASLAGSGTVCVMEKKGGEWEETRVTGMLIY